MKKIMILCLSIIILTSSMFVSTAYEIGEVINKAKHTDIVAYINHYAIKSYNIDGNTAIVVEDLMKYGFNVVWDANTKTLYVDKKENHQEIFADETLTRTQPSLYGEDAVDILYTDIKTYIQGKEVNSYNIGGNTAIIFDDLKDFGRLEWNGTERAIKLWVDNVSINKTRQILSDSGALISAPIGGILCESGLGFSKNSVHGITLYWMAKNLTGKTIHYYTIYVSLINPVGDPAYCEIKNTSTVKQRVVGIIKPGDTLVAYDIIAYAPACSKVVIDYIHLEYEDGTEETVIYGYEGYKTLKVY